MRVRKHWLPRTNIHFKVRKSDGVLMVGSSVLSEVHIIELIKWLQLWLSYRKASPKTQLLDEARIMIRRAGDIIKDNQRDN